MPSVAPQPTGTAGLPACEQVAAALGSLIDGLDYDETASTQRSQQESYEQRSCVFGPATGRLGVTIAAIPFLPTELEAYSTAPGTLADDRTAARGAVLQTFEAGDGDDGHLDSALYLFDLEYSITIQEDGGELPQLTVAAAADAAFAIRELIPR